MPLLFAQIYKGGFFMNDSIKRDAWVEPEIRDLDVMETNAFPRLGADVGGNPGPDCQRS